MPACFWLRRDCQPRARGLFLSLQVSSDEPLVSARVDSAFPLTCLFLESPSQAALKMESSYLPLLSISSRAWSLASSSLRQPRFGMDSSGPVGHQELVGDRCCLPCHDERKGPCCLDDELLVLWLDCLLFLVDYQENGSVPSPATSVRPSPVEISQLGSKPPSCCVKEPTSRPSILLG